MNDVIVKAENLRYKYKDSGEFIIQNHDFLINKGEVIGIIGPNGAGKTTLCLAIKGIIPHKLGGKWGGTLTVCNTDVSNSSISNLSKYVAMTFQNPETQIVGTTVEEDLAFMPENLGIKPEIINKKIDYFMDIVGLPRNYKKRAPFNMSGGEKQRLAIASSLIAEPELIILDEPTTELDPVGKLEVIKVVQNIVKDGNSTFIVIEQDLDNIINIADRLFVIVDGRIALQGPTREVLSHASFLEEKQINVSDVVKLWASTPLKEKYPIFLNTEEASDAINREIENKRLSISSISKKIVFNDENKNILEIKELSFKYQDNIVLKNVNLNISKGDFLAILGKNGAGKTTLVKHMNGLLKPTKGMVILDGVNSETKTVAEMARKVAYVFQNPDHQIFAQTVEEEIAFGPRNLGWSEEKIQERVEYALKACSIDKYRAENPLSLERGLKQLLILASVISMDVEVFIVDEPTTGLSREYKRIIGEVLKELNARGKTIILVTHDMQFVAEFAKRAIVIKDGQVNLTGEIREVFSQIKNLEQSSIYPPQITLVANKLNFEFNELPISVEEMLQQMKWRGSNE